MSEYIIHYGVKGMKWGVRKDDYNVKQGPAPTTGSNGYGNAVSKGIADFVKGGHPEAKKSSDTSAKTEGKKKKSDDTEKAIKGMNTLGKTAQRGSSAAQKIDKATKKETPKKDLSQLSDAELQQRVNRLNLERQYNSLTTKETKTGWQKASEVLDIAGDVIMVGVGIATIYKTFKK